MWGIFVDNHPLCVLDRETGGTMPMLFQGKTQPIAIAEVMNKELSSDIAVRPVEIRVHKEEKNYELRRNN